MKEHRDQLQVRQGVSPDIGSKTVASLHKVGQGCRVPLLVNLEL